MINIYDVCDCYESVDENGNTLARYPKPLESLALTLEMPDVPKEYFAQFNILDGSDILWKRIREKRNILLLECDWTQTPDCTVPDIVTGKQIGRAHV